MLRIYNRIVFLNETLRCGIVTLLVYLKARVISMSLSRGCKFYGFPYLRLATGSLISIGTGCRFRSLMRMSNQAGICRPCTIETLTKNARITIGDNCGFSGAMISSAIDIKIGHNVLVGANSSITDTDWHGILPESRGFKYAKKSPVIIEDNVWLGMNVVVLKGSKIGKNTIIASNSVVNGLIPENVIAAGNPAKVVKQLS